WWSCSCIPAAVGASGLRRKNSAKNVSIRLENDDTGSSLHLGSEGNSRRDIESSAPVHSLDDDGRPDRAWDPPGPACPVRTPVARPPGRVDPGRGRASYLELDAARRL